MALFQDLQARGLCEQLSDPALAALLDGGGLTVYSGFDPTAPSLHVGSLMPIVCLMRLQRAGHRPIAVVGGATGRIGDPSGRSEERKLLGDDDLAQNLAGIRAQLGRFLDFGAGGARDALAVDNYDWFQGLGFVEFLRRIGKHFSVNMMLAKESVRARLEDRDHGISYTEFSYMLMQAYDFLWLHEHHGCTLQIGGNDQWGNITAGIELIRRVRQQPAYGFTHPLITTADGKKFGKSEGGNIWLDAERTSPYQMFQYFLNADDRDAGRLLKFFTFLPVTEIDDLVRSSSLAPEKRAAQRVLAREVTRLVHGQEAAARAEEGAAALFGGGGGGLEDLLDQPGIPRTARSRTQLTDGVPLLDLLRDSHLAKSLGEARRDISGGGIYLNEERVTDSSRTVTVADLKKDAFVLLRKGKKNYHIVRFE
ncbi:MAG: tyrosine--tRNA ligase [Myxococcales bacterium]|nr:tyrosine--tRNA ligase [Myxococcales bacterium]